MTILNGFWVFKIIEKHIISKTPLSLIRLGDGEGAILGYPKFATLDNAKSVSKVWFGEQELSCEDYLKLSEQMKIAVRSADVVGVPRKKQITKQPLYKAVFNALENFSLLSEQAKITDAAIHRYLQFALLYRPILKNRDFVGIISSRDIRTQLTEVFNIKHIELYQVKGEERFPGVVEKRHYPAHFEWLKKNINVPYQGAIFLVGAGGLGKIYCNVIKQKGGIAIDVGAIFDAWAGVPSRLKKPCHYLSVYDNFPEITAKRAMFRYNRLIKDLNLDTSRANVNDMQGSLEKW